MAGSKHKRKHHDQETIKPGKGRKDELSEKDLDKASGGVGGSGGTSGIAGIGLQEKWINLDVFGGGTNNE